MNQVDYEVFNTLKNKMKAKFPILLEGFLRDARTYIVTIETNLPDGRLQDILEASHSLKSASGLLGLVHVQSVAEDIEYSAKTMMENGEDNLVSLISKHEKLQSAFSDVVDFLDSESKKARQAHSGM